MKQVYGIGEYSGTIDYQLTVGGLVLSRTSYCDHKSLQTWHSHENLHVSFAFQPGISESQSKALGDTRRFNNGVFVYESGEKHRWIPSSPKTTSLNVEVCPDFHSQIGLTQAEIKRAVLRQNSALQMLLLHVELLQEPLVREEILPIVLEMFSLEEGTGAILPKWAVNMRELLNDEWQSSATLEELAAVLNVHPVTISRSFRRFFSMSLNDYRRRIRVDHGIRQIVGTNKSLTEIAMSCGFADQSHFTRSCKGVTGLLPKQIRRLTPRR